MSNEQIIEEIAIQVYGEEAVMQMHMDGVEIPLHTAQGWNARGNYRVKKGEHGIETRLWKKKKDNTYENEDKAVAKEQYYLCKAFLFRIDQVEMI